MEKHSIFTFFKKFSWVGIILVLFLAGCQGATTEPIDANSGGWFDHYFVYPFSLLIKAIASMFNGSFGLSIIIITIMIRLAVMPFMLKQTKNNLHMQDQMKKLKPEMDALQEKYKNKNDVESKQKMQQELMQLYQKHDINPLATFGGCLPVLIQFPFLIGFYYAILRTPEIATHSFLWFDLGQADILLTFIAVAIYFVQFKISQIGLDEKVKKQMAIMGLISPIMIGVISFNAPAVLPLYWAVGGLFIIVQTLISKQIYAAHKKKNE